MAEQAKNQNQRPQRKDFKVTVFLAPNGTIVDEKDAQKVIGDKQGKDRRAVLRENGWKEVSNFNRQDYEAAVKSFREQARTATTTARTDMFNRIFDEAGVKPNARLKSALRTLQPGLQSDNQDRIETALVKVCRAVDGLLKSDPAPRQAGARRGRKNAKSNDKQSGAAA